MYSASNPYVDMPTALLDVLRITPVITGVVLYLAPIQAMHMIRSDQGVALLPLLPYSSMCIAATLFTLYSILISDTTLLVPNAIGAVSGLCFVMFYTYYSRTSITFQHLSVFLALLLGIMVVYLVTPHTSALADTFGYTADACVVAMFMGPLTVMREVVTNRNARIIPWAFTAVSLVNCTMWVLYGTLVLLDPVVIVPNVLGLASSLVQLSLIYAYPNKPLPL